MLVWCIQHQGRLDKTVGDIFCGRCRRPTDRLRRGMCRSCYDKRRDYAIFTGQWDAMTRFADAQPVREHLHKLLTAGLSQRRISELSGMPRRALNRFASGRRDRGKPDARISKKYAKGIMSIAIPVGEDLRDVVNPYQYIDSIGTLRRMRALVAFGYTRSQLAEMLNVTSHNGIQAMLRDETLHVTAQRAKEVAALYDKLKDTPGPSSRACFEGRTKGWELPWEWDDDEIDRWTLRLDERAPEPIDQPLSLREQYDELRYLGYGLHEISQRLDVEPYVLRAFEDREAG